MKFIKEHWKMLLAGLVLVYLLYSIYSVVKSFKDAINPFTVIKTLWKKIVSHLFSPASSSDPTVTTNADGSKTYDYGSGNRVTNNPDGTFRTGDTVVGDQTLTINGNPAYSGWDGGSGVPLTFGPGGFN